jgi:hypothetical protein
MVELGTIEGIKTLRDEIRLKIKDLSTYSKENYGRENEYSHKGIVGGIQSLLTDISTLTKAKNKFIQISTFEERQNIYNYMVVIRDYFDTPSNYIDHFESLKLILRSFGVRNFSDRQLEFDQECQNVLKLKIQFEEELKEVRKIKSKIVAEEKKVLQNSSNYEINSAKILTEIEDLVEQKTKLINESTQLQTVLQSSNRLEVEIREQARLVGESSTNLKSNEKLIDSFANKVQEKDNRLTELEQEIHKQKEKILVYEEERKKILSEAKDLIESAKLALNYKTAEGISASFNSRFDEAKSKWRYYPWLIGSAISMLTAIALGLVITYTTSDSMWFLARISLIPLPIISAIFCAKQYSKQKNIIEDYAYKMVLAKAIVGFSEQLKKNGSDDNSEYVHYIKTSLEEIHKDPLRKRDREKKSNELNLDNIIEIAEKIKKLVKIEG